MGKIIYDTRDGYKYISDLGIKYSLYEGKSIGGETTSDMIFIMCDNSTSLDDVIGNVNYMYVDWFFGASCLKDEKFRRDATNVIDDMVKEYEIKHPEVVNYFLPPLTEREIKEMVSTKVLKNISDSPTQTILRQALYCENNIINWKDLYKEIITQMPELRMYKPGGNKND